jgi:hypothetical protein
MRIVCLDFNEPLAAPQLEYEGTCSIRETGSARKTKVILPVLLGDLLFAYPSWAWFAEGHEVVAIIAADDLTPIARSHVAQILAYRMVLVQSKRQ